ncbi:MAG: tetratricopeptide repeat protein [Candidatus Omnitrophica bacterium]|nr:tetratricopeptide repeat protein [Candidatus Omnitrophota bacterium]
MKKRPVLPGMPARILTIIFGLFLCLALLELGLRLGGFAVLSLQESRNRLCAREKGAYRIMCLGESTTAFGGVYSYPSQLQDILNRRGIGVRFSVINKGVPGIHTSDILNRLESDLDAYRPDMVIAMMGINDRGTYMFSGGESGSKAVNSLKSLRIYKLAGIFGEHIAAFVKNPAKDKLNRYISKPEGPKGILHNPEEAGEALPENDWSYVGMGRPYQIQGKLAIAEAACVKTIDRIPDNDKAYWELGWIYRAQGRCSKAEASFRKAIELNPKNYWPYIEQDRYAEAEAVFKKAIKLNPEDGWSHIGLGWVYRDQARLFDAGVSFKEAARVNPENIAAYLELGWAYRDQGRLFEAEAVFAKAAELDPLSNIAYFELGWIYEHQARCAEAEAVFKKAIELAPQDYWPYVEIGRFYLKQDRFAEADAAFKKASGLNPGNDWPYIGLGQSYHAQGRLPDAEALFRKAIELDPGNKWAYIGMKKVYAQQSRHFEPVALFKKAIESNPQEAWPYFELGLVYRSGGRLYAAEPLLKKALELDPANDMTSRALKLLYIEMGDLRLAMEYEKKADELRAGYYPQVVIENYRKLKAALDKRGITYVCAQYPMRSIEPLKKIFRGEDGGVIFADNQAAFQEALKKKGYDEYFTDMFGGDFGHCTPEGNRLLAENIADVILDKVFSVNAVIK